MGELKGAGTAAYVSESNCFENDWQRSYWGSNYERLRAIKQHSMIRTAYSLSITGSAARSGDGFVTRAAN